ncbi:tetratricopeptide repeat protein [Roseicella aquatilis]|uniref:protein O-GlcNAc transferase n=1 Tax=Roseicella aquatilis TaxID=2527868 RepID=A0A4R4D1S6_9PROT|nr:tetratricopeptide repeat protein [Roseicella aquatilis]TCZ51084.1 tetratricopeptide repeat protein [Roseicella aquatilis]
MKPQQRPAPGRSASSSAVPGPSEAELRQRLAEAPGRANDWQQLGQILAAAGRHAEAAEAFDRAIAAGASALPLTLPLAASLAASGQVARAVEVAAAAHARRPKEFLFANLLGVMLRRAGRPEEALAALQTARRLDPRAVSACQNLGNLFDQMGRFREAAAAYQAGLRIEPRNGTLHGLLGRMQRMAGDMPAAVASLERAMTFGPVTIDTLTSFAGALVEVGEEERALAAVARVRQAHPGDPLLDILEARIALRLGRREDARALAERALERAPGNPDGCLLLARLHGEGDLRAANEALRRGIAADPGQAALVAALIENLVRSRYDDEAAHVQEAHDLACRLLQADPAAARLHPKPLRTVFMMTLDHDRLDACGELADIVPRWLAEGEISGLHYALGHVESLEHRLRLVEWHRAWGRREESAIAPLALPPTPALSTGRKLRIGFMSSDLRDHPVTYFALPLLEGFDRDRAEVFCYSFYEREQDAVQAHIAQQVTGFRWWPRRRSPEIAAGIAEDRLDILFELGGTTAMNRLDVMAYRPARIGASWLGYPHSAGLERIDYILVDPYIRPEDPRLLIEQPFEMPESWVAMGRIGFREVPIEEGLPEERRGHLTFGTMNNPYKFTRLCLDAWAGVLRAVPGSRFLFVRPETRTRAFVENVRAAFAARDVDPDRIEYVGVRGTHLQHYNSIDIALDSLPHVGGTTTCETLWMGVPCVSLVGPGFPERLSYSNLSNAGLGDLAVFSPEDYVAKAAELAEDRGRRRMLRRGLRGMIRGNPLGQPDRFVHAFYARAEEVARR